MAIQKVGVVGCGLMGSGIAQVSAAAGFATRVREVSPNALDQGLGSIRRFMQAGVDKGKLAAAEMEATLGNVHGTLELRDLADCDLVIEAVTENVALKREILATLDAACPAATILASNTSSLSITEMSTFVRRCERMSWR